MISLKCEIFKKMKQQNNKKTELTETENRLVVDRGRGWGMGEMEEDGERVQTSRCKITKSWEGSVLPGASSQ